MTISSLTDLVERQSVEVIECTIPAGMTVEQWRSLRQRRSRRRSARLGRPARTVVPLRPVNCDHLCETTTRYDAARKLLTFFLVCPRCGTAEVVSTMSYEPRFVPTPAPDAPGAALPAGDVPARPAFAPRRRAA